MLHKNSKTGNSISCDKMELYKSLGSLIKDYRQWRKLSQETIAESIGISVRELGNWERNCCPARIDNLHDLSEVTGIPMQVCLALNADQPIWYSLQKRRFAYSSGEVTESVNDNLLSYNQQPDDGILIRNNRITTDRHINMILSCHGEIHGTSRPLGEDVIKTASMVLPELNRIIFDCWGHYVGHQVCLPIKKDTYEKIKQE
ncbi:MAG: helix-turn-helix transcriptional regulator, partial [Nitrospirota bacterium]